MSHTPHANPSKPSIKTHRHMKPTIHLLLSALLLLTSGLQAQETFLTQSGNPTRQPRFPLESYEELPTEEVAESSWLRHRTPFIGWGATDVRYNNHPAPQAPQAQTQLRWEGWRGERVNAQAVVWPGTEQELKDVHFEFTPLNGPGNARIAPEALTAHFVREVMTDQLNHDGRGGCGDRNPAHFKALMVSDAIDHLLTRRHLRPRHLQPVWVQCHIPTGIPAGHYRGQLHVKSGSHLLRSLHIDLRVVDRELPPPSQWAFHLDLWQNPFAVARYYRLPLWSDAHLEAMRPLMKRLAEAGQKVITTSIMHKPWNGQTEDFFETMVTWTKRVDGSWDFDYAVFDRWVEFMMSLGIDRQINCYSMVPWRLSFQYFDQATNSLQTIATQPGKPEYEAMWTAMLTSFAAHLKAKGWFERTTIAMDERPMEVMQKTLEVIRKADPDFKVSLAGNYHPEIEPLLHDYCIAIGQDFPAEVRRRRLQEGRPTTLYTCCTEAHPNTFTFSNPAEATWIGYHMALRGMDGYLRWAYNSWPLEPLLDSRFRSWAGGDTYLVYPANRSSIRFERLLEGIQAHEKINLLRREFAQKNHTAGLRQIERLLAPFALGSLPEADAGRVVEQAHRKLNAL